MTPNEQFPQPSGPNSEPGVEAWRAFNGLLQLVGVDQFDGLLKSAQQANDRQRAGITSYDDEGAYSILIDDKTVSFTAGDKSHVIDHDTALLGVIWARENS